MTVTARKGARTDAEEATVTEQAIPGATAAQQGAIRKGLARHVDGVGYREGRDAFSCALHALAYAVARKTTKPKDRAEASALISCLRGDPDSGIIEYARRRTKRGASIRRRAIAPLAEQYGYPKWGWLDGLNEAIAARMALYDAKERLDFGRDPELYRKVVLDPLMFDRRGGRR